MKHRPLYSIFINFTFLMCLFAKKSANILQAFLFFIFFMTGPEFPHAAFLFHPPFRKPKRIRTAFSPSQLLRLEQAFEKNHYVVGAERKQLAASLNLTETQVRNNCKIISHDALTVERGGGRGEMGVLH